MLEMNNGILFSDRIAVLSFGHPQTEAASCLRVVIVVQEITRNHTLQLRSAEEHL